MKVDVLVSVYTFNFTCNNREAFKDSLYTYVLHLFERREHYRPRTVFIKMAHHAYAPECT